MESLLNIIINELEKQATNYDEVGEPGSYEMGLRLQFAVNSLTRFRDTLISIANCQGAVPSIQAWGVLVDAGLCSHSGSIYKAACGSIEGKHICPNCGKTDPVQMVPFQ